MRIALLLLLAVVTSGAQDPPVQVHLNHAYITPDAETYEAIRNSEFVKRFAVWEERTTHRKDMSYTGFYLYGQHTYFEFLKPSDAGKAHGSQIAFGVDESGGLAALQERAQAAGMKTEILPVTREFNGKDVAWFRMLQRTDTDAPSVGIWTLEYEPTFLTGWNPQPKAKASIRREDVLARYAQVVKQKQASKLMADVTTIYLNVPTAGLEQSVKECKALGFKALAGDSSAFCRSDNLTIIVRARSDRFGIAAIRFRLGREAKEGEYKIGHTVLNIQEKAALWNFMPDQESFRGRHEQE